MAKSLIEIDWKTEKLTIGAARPRLGFSVTINGRKIRGLIMAIDISLPGEVTLGLDWFDQYGKPFPLPDVLPAISYGLSDPALATITPAADLRTLAVVGAAAGVETVSVAAEGYEGGSLDITFTQAPSVLTRFGLSQRFPEPTA